MVSRRGLRDRRHKGHRNFRSLAACISDAVEVFIFRFADLGRGTQVPRRYQVASLTTNYTTVHLSWRFKLQLIRIHFGTSIFFTNYHIHNLNMTSTIQACTLRSELRIPYYMHTILNYQRNREKHISYYHQPNN